MKMALCRVHTSTKVQMVSVLIIKEKWGEKKSFFFKSRSTPRGNGVCSRPRPILHHPSLDPFSSFCFFFACDPAAKPTETRWKQNLTLLVTVLITIRWHLFWVARREVSVNSKGYNSVQFSPSVVRQHHGEPTQGTEGIPSEIFIKRWIEHGVCAVC